MKRKKIISAVAGALFAALLALGVVGFVCMRSTSAFQLDSENVDTGKSAVLLQDQLITVRQDESEYRLVSCGADGETLWSYEMEDYLTMLSAVGDSVYVGAGRSVFVLDQTGSLRDSFSLDYIPTGIAGNSDTIAVTSSISTTKNVLSVYRVSDSGTVELTYDLDFNRKILQVSVGEDGSVLFGTGNAVFECVKSASDRYTAVKLFDAHLSFDGLYAKSREVVYIKPIYYSVGTKNRVFAYYGKPSTVCPEIGYPAVLLIHGGDGCAYYEWVKEWTDKGFVAIAPDFSAQFAADEKDRLKKNPLGGPIGYGSVADFKEESSWLYFGVASAFSALDVLCADSFVDQTRLFVQGISWGGFLALAYAAFDSRLRALSVIYSSAFISEASGAKIAD